MLKECGVMLIVYVLYGCCANAAESPPASSGEAAALLAFRRQLNPLSLDRLSAWSHADTSPCGWWRVRCDNGGRVVALELQDLNLIGPLSSDLAELRYLTYLNLSANQLSGSIPAELSGLRSLTQLDLHQNNLTGSIPTKLSLCANLVILDLSRNPLSGTIPASFGALRNLRMIQLHHIPLLTGPLPLPLLHLPNLTHLCLGTNNLTGRLPSEIALLSHLQDLAIYENPNMEGPIPTSLGQLRSLRSLKLFTLNLAGTSIPAELGNLTSLQYLYLFNSRLEGSIPQELGNLAKLKVLYIGFNNLSGTLPASLGRLTQLIELNLYNNSLHGAIPPHLGNLSSLINLFLPFNHLSHSLPPELGNLHKLQEFQIYVNNLSGPLPPQLGRLTNLRHFYAFNNRFHGELPPQLGNLTRLEAVFLGLNRFERSSIPPEWGQLRSLQSLELSQNELAGEIPSSLGNLSKLVYLKLTGNKLHGRLPMSLANCRQLERLKVENNLLEGEIPKEYFTSLLKLHTLSLSGNRLGGEIPDKIASLANLSVLNLGHNRFRGRIPNSWSVMRNLTVLNLGGNELEGDLPSWIWTLNQLKVLDLSNNAFTGSISPEIKNLEGFTSSKAGKVAESMTLWDDDTPVTAKGIERWYSAYLLSVMTSLDLSRNKLHGVIPSEVGHLTALFNLNLSGNALQGGIPHSFGGLRILESLDLSSNRLCGEIPQELSIIPTLAVFNVSYNLLLGPIPQGGGTQFPFSESSYLGNMSLCGKPLFLQCNGASSQNTSKCSNESSVLIEDKSKKKNKTALILFGALLGSASLLAIFLLLAWKVKRRYLYKHSKCLQVFDKDMRRFRHELMNMILQGCNSSNQIGAGGLSVVHKLTLSSGKVVAVKKLSIRNSSIDAQKSFLRESKILGRIKHRNIIKLLGVYSSSNGETCLACIFDFKSNGTLDDRLHHINEAVRPLTWNERLNIAIGIAQGICYLHNESGFGEIFHLDLKPSNILLDDDQQPCISDFGNAKMRRKYGRSWTSQSHLFATIGYAAPELAYLNTTSDKADVYSFGILLLEMMTGKTPIVHESPSDDLETIEVMDLRSWVIVSLSMQREIFDPCLEFSSISISYAKQQALAMIEIALLCTMQNANNRPNIRKVLDMIINCSKIAAKCCIK